MSDSRNWALAQSIDPERRVVVIQMGIIDSFGEFHPEEESSSEWQNPAWLTMTFDQFVEAATIEAQSAMNRTDARPVVA